MLRRLLSLALVLGLLVPSLAGVAAAKGARGKSEGIKVQSVSYDAGTGDLTTTVRWHKRELKKDGRDALHVVVYHDGDDPQVLSDQTVDATFDEHIRTHRITLSPEQRETAGDGSHLVVVVTHKHDDDGGLFDRVWHHRLPVAATARAAAANCSQIQPFANLSGCDLSYANLTGANLTAATLYRANLTGANLTGAHLTGATLTAATLYRANLFGADLTGARLNYADLTDANLSYANLTGANLYGARLTYANLTGVTYCNTTMTDGTTNNANC